MPSGIYKRTEEHKKKIGLSRKGKTHSQDTKVKISLKHKGRKHTKEHTEKIRKFLLGRSPSIETRMKMSLAHKGEKGSGWKGGVTKIHNRIRKSLEYKLWRKAVLERDDFKCCFCGKRGGRLHADHIKPFALFPELRFAIDNGRTLCIPCHRTTETYGVKLFK